MRSVNDKVLKLAFQGEWEMLLPILGDYPHLVNLPSEPKGYTPLHQAAWHGANLSVIGELLSLGADRSATTNTKLQTAYDIVVENLNWSIFFSHKKRLSRKSSEKLLPLNGNYSLIMMATKFWSIK